MSSPWTLKPHFRGGRAHFKALLLGSCGLLCAFSLSSCGQSTPGSYGGSPESNVSSGTLEPLTVPPNADDRPPAPGTTGARKTSDGLPALRPKGLNTHLFSKKLSDEGDRLDRLENAVQEIRNDFDAISPAIVRLVSIEKDIQFLVTQLEGITGQPASVGDIPPIDEAVLDGAVAPAIARIPEAPEPLPGDPLPDVRPDAPIPNPTLQSAPVAQEQIAPVSNAPIMETQPVAPVATALPATTAPPGAAVVQGPSVQNIRVGEHPDKTRIVLDISGKSSFTTDLDNQEKILVVEIPEAGWNAVPQQDFAKAPLLSSYRVEKMGGKGTRLIFVLKKGVSIAYKAVMEDSSGAGGRIVIDLVAAP